MSETDDHGSPRDFPGLDDTALGMRTYRLDVLHGRFDHVDWARTWQFLVNPEIGRGCAEMTRDLRVLGWETRKRRVNNNDVEDQAAREAGLREARARLN